MKIEVKIDSSCTEPKLILITDRITDEISLLIKQLTDDSPHILSGFRNDMAEILNQPDIIRIYSAAGKVFAVTAEGEYLLRLRLYELENRLEKSSFARISNTEIVNLKKVKSFDLSFSGTICVSLSDGAVTYVSRRYVSKIKQLLGI